MRLLTLTVLLALASTAVLAAPSHLDVRNVDSDYGALDSLTDLWAMLKRAAEIGNEELRKVLDDPRVDALIQRLTGFAKKAALRAIQYFKNLLEKPAPMTLVSSSNIPIESDQNSIYDVVLVDKIFDLLFEAKKSGQEELRKALESSDLTNFIDEINSLKVKLFMLSYVRELKETISDSTKTMDEIEPIFNSFQDEMEIVKEIWHALNVAASAGKDALLRVLRDPKIIESVDNLGYFARKSALKILDFFESKLLDEPQPISDEAQPITNESSMSILRRVYSLLVRANREGTIALKNILESEELSQLIATLPERYLTIVQTYIATFTQILELSLEEEEVLSMIAVADTSDGNMDEVEEDQIADLIVYASTVESINQEEKVTAAEILRLIRSYIEQSAKEGKAKLEEVLKSDYLKGLIVKLPSSMRVFINTWLDIFRAVINE
jgi:hypothetical protein